MVPEAQDGQLGGEPVTMWRLQLQPWCQGKALGSGWGQILAPDPVPLSLKHITPLTPRVSGGHGLCSPSLLGLDPLVTPSLRLAPRQCGTSWPLSLLP